MSRRKARGNEGPEPSEENGAPARPTPPADQLSTLITASPVTADTPLKVGDTVQAEWGGSWWPAQVLRVQKNGQVKITYPGWGSEWDEAVPRSRLRLETAGLKYLKIVVDSELSLTGTFTGFQSGFIILTRDSDGRRMFVNAQRVAYFEVSDQPEEE